MNQSEYIHKQSMYYHKSCKDTSKLLGAEMEHFLVDALTLRSYSYFEPNGQKEVVEKLILKGWNLFLEEEHYPLGIEKDGNTITFEPGGQFEISLRPLETVMAIDETYQKVLKEIESVLADHQALVGIGYHPKTKIEDLPLLPKKRYEMMYTYFKTHGAKAHNMMKGTAATQVSIDYTSEADFIKKFRVAYFLSPILAHLFDATPIFEGELYPREHARVAIWEETDRPRSKLIPGVMNKVFGFADYCKYLLNLPPILMEKNHHSYFTGEDTLAALLQKEVFTESELEHFQTMVFPDVRLKSYLEIRMADAMPYPYNMAFFTVIETLFYNVDLLNELYTWSLDYDDAWVIRQNAYLMSDKFVENSELMTMKLKLLKLIDRHLNEENQKYWQPFVQIIEEHGTLANWLKKVYQTNPDQFAKEVMVVEKRQNKSKKGSQMVQWIMDNPDDFKQDYQSFIEGVAQSKAIYKGAPVPTLYVPMVYTPRDVDAFQQALKGMFSVVNTTIDLYLTQPEVRALFGFEKKLDDLIQIPHAYDTKVPMGRFDIFYYGEGHYMFCELNADGASAMNEQKELADVWLKTELKKTFEKQENLTMEAQELFHSWVDEVKTLYDSYSNTTGLKPLDGEKPVVAIVDFIDKSSPIEFEVFKKAFEANGYPCVIADPRELKCIDGRLFFEDQMIDIIYRRLVTKDLIDRYDEVPQLVEGLIAGKTCVIGSIKTQIIHSKRFFEVLHHPVFQKFITESQRNFIELHIPYTAKLDLKDIYIQRKDDYIIKPMDYYASKGVCAGQDYTKDQWAALLREKSCEDYIVQRYCPLSLVENVLYNKEGEFERHWFKTITGLFTYNEKLKGVYVRAGLNAIISGLHDGYTMSTFVIKE